MKKDIAKKRLEEHNDVYADIFNALLFEGRPVLQEKYLVPLPTEAFTRSLDGSLRQGNRDIRKADCRNGQYRLICSEENQEGLENTMPQRLMGYDFAAYEEQIRLLTAQNDAAGRPAYTRRIHDDQRLAPVVSLVLYWGEEEWRRPLCLHDMLEFPPDIREQVKPYVADYPMNLIQMARLTEEERSRFTSDFRLVAEYAAKRKDTKALKQLMADQTHPIRHPEEFLDVLSAISGDRRFHEIAPLVQEGTKKEGMTMYSIAEELENKGIRQGAQSKAEAVARNMFKRNMSPEDTAAICEVSLAQVQDWFKEWEKTQR